ncbi:nucleotidyltransferase domain-containing protein [Streptomyces sp. NPDC058195]|uniref:nucleotidyltransferase domain-containing protein n=1 Tax=Streptomyces sp. NPDC058195 TaxID=3346375 RepID=UPI0036ED44C4
MTSSSPIDPAREPWNLARRFACRLTDVLGDTLREVVVVGSASLGDWQAESDIDLVCVVERELDSRARDAVAPLHEKSREAHGHTIDAMYVTRDGLAKGPDALRSVVATVAGALHPESSDGPMNWPTWLNIVQCGVRVPLAEDGAMAVVEPGSAGFPIEEETAREGAIRFSRANLGQYWSNRIRLSEQIYLADGATHPVSAFEVEWMSLGPARLLATVRTGRIVSKSEGGELAAAQWPDFRPHLTRVLEARRGPDTGAAWSREDLERSLGLARLCVDLGTGT